MKVADGENGWGLRTFWTMEEIEQVQALKADGVEDVEIARRMGRSTQSVRSKFHKVKHGHLQNDGKNAWTERKSLTAQEIEQLKHLRDVERLSFTKIAKIMGRPSATVASKHCYLRTTMPIRHDVEQRGTFVIPPEVREDWRRRQMLDHRDLTSAFMGDPLPGMSALDQRND